MSETLYYCKGCGRGNFLRRGGHRSAPGAAKCKAEDMEPQGPTSCLTCKWRALKACPDDGVIRRSPWHGCGAWTAESTSYAPEPAPVVTPIAPDSSDPSGPPESPTHAALKGRDITAQGKAAEAAALGTAAVAPPSSPVRAPQTSRAPTLNDGHDAATAKRLLTLYTEAQSGMRRVVALGLFAWELKETRLKHGEFGAWLSAHCPTLATARPTGQPIPSRALQGYMDLTKSVLDSLGFTIEKYLTHISKAQTMRFCQGGKYLLSSPKADKKLPAEARELKTRICELVDGKTARQLFLEFKQAEEDTATGDLKPKIGRLKGQGGASKEQRVAAQQADDNARLEAIRIKADEVHDWLIEVADDQHLGAALDPGQRDNLMNALATALAYLRRLSVLPSAAPDAAE